MERIGSWIWREHQRHFVALTVLVIAIFVALTVVVPSVAVGSIFLHLELRDGLMWFWIVIAALALVSPLAFGTLRPRLTSVRAWARGVRGPDDAAAVWEILLRLPGDVTIRLVAIACPVVGGVTYPWVVSRADPDVQGSLALGLSYIVVTLCGATLVSTVARLVLRPAVADVESHLDRVASFEVRGGSIRGRLALVIFTASWLNGVALPAAVLGGSADSNDYLVALIGSALSAVYFSWLFNLGVLKPTLRPLGDVIAATVRVRRGDIGTPVSVASNDELGDLAVAFNEMQRGLAQREALRAAFGSYVDPVLAQRLMDSGSPVFDGEDLIVSVLFADVRDFTRYSEGVSSAEAVTFLNRLFDVIVPAVHQHGGHANHYLGDGLLAVFGAPQPLVRHADAAVAAAIEIQRSLRAALSDEVRVGIGINTGPVIAGTVGGGGRHEFTVIGDTVNVASRVEKLTKHTGDLVLITEATRQALSTPRPRTARRGVFEVRGRSRGLTLYAVNPFPRVGETDFVHQ